MHTIDISEEGLSHLPEGLSEFTDLDENNYIWATDGAISIGTNWDYDSMNEDFMAAGGGIAKEAGDGSGPPPVRGPNSQGLLSLKNRVRNY